jgi:hypothetical protein
LVLGLLAGTLLCSNAVGAEGTSPTVVFDEGHGQRFLVGEEGELDLSGLGKIISEAGGRTESARGPLTAEILRGAHALVISGPFAPLTTEEMLAVRRFVHDGGRVSVMLHIAPTAVDLLRMMGTTPSNGVVNEAEGVIGANPLDFTVTRLGAHPLTQGIESFNVYGAWAVMATGNHARVIAGASPRAWLDTDRDRSRGDGEPSQAYGIVVAGGIGRGEFVVFGDDAIFQNRFLQGGNLALAKNLAGWLLSKP